MTVWPRLDQLEKHIKRLTVALTMATVTPDPTVAEHIEITTEFVMHLANIVTYLAVDQEYLVQLTP